MARKICGIQQIGFGVPNVDEAWKWYRVNFGMDVPIFRESAEAKLMINYTGNEVHARDAALAMNLQGGGGAEIWQFTSRKSQKANFEFQIGDLGIFSAVFKSRDVKKAYEDFKKRGENILGNLSKDPQGKDVFFVKDPYGMIHTVSYGVDWFSTDNKLTGGIAGATLGTSNIDKILPLYKEVLGFDKVIYDQTGTFDDLAQLPGGKDRNFRRVLLTASKKPQGGFSNLLGTARIELIQALDYEGKKMFKDRFWGDIGFIHLCFDVQDMADLRTSCEKAGYPFTVDSANSFDMGEAAGHFSYIEDHDGTLIEFVETHKIPILKKIGWYLNLRDRNPEKPVPTWMLKTLALNRVK
jgi:catechol 2,3-dioxygenase-like lactoylglutathione lyase family enzyme/uncharacterized glyoxalase superfamily protein PhnB